MRGKGEIMFATQMFDARKTVFDGIGKSVVGAQNAETAMKLAGLDYKVVKKEIITKDDGILLPDNYAIVREDNNTPLGVVGNQYQIVQNTEAFEITNDLVGEGLLYETAGYFKQGQTVFLLGLLPKEYSIPGEKMEPYIFFVNSHDGSGALKICMTFVRVWCSNTMNLALRTAKRSWSVVHKRGIHGRIDEARETLGLARNYKMALNDEVEKLAKVKLSPITLEKVVLPNLIPINDGMTPRQVEARMEQRAELRYRYLNAPDLSEIKLGDHHDEHQQSEGKKAVLIFLLHRFTAEAGVLCSRVMRTG